MRFIHQILCVAIAVISLETLTLPALSNSIYMQDNLVGDYPFNGNAEDESLNDNHGIVNGATLVVDRFGNSNRAYDFDGVSAFIQLPDSSVFAYPSYSVSLWFRAEQYPNSLDHDHEAAMLISKGRNDFEIHLGSAPFSDTGIRFLPRFAGANTGQYWDATTANFPIDEWQNIIAVYDGSANESHLYLNGVDLPLGHATGPDQIEPSVPARLGMRYDGSIPFNGQLDDIRIYDRVLSGIEALKLYEHESSKNIPYQSHIAILLSIGLCGVGFMRRALK